MTTKTEYQVTKQIRFGSLFGFVGFLLMIFDFFPLDYIARKVQLSVDTIVFLEEDVLVWTPLIGIVLLWVGIITTFKSKGYKGSWGYLLCLVAPLGWFIVLFLSNRRSTQTTPKTVRSRKLLWASLIVLGTIPAIYFYTMPELSPGELQNLEASYRWFVEMGGHVGSANKFDEFIALSGYDPARRHALDAWNHKTNRANTPFDTRHIFLRGTQISDGDLVRLKVLKYVRDIDLSDTNISDQGLTCLYDMKVLRYLKLSNTKVSDGGIEKLKRVLPSCEIEH